MSSRDSWVLRQGILWSAEFGGPGIRPVVTTGVPVEFGRIAPVQTDRLMAAVRQIDPISPEAIVKRLKMGRECFSVEVDGSIAAYGWLTRGPEWVGEFERELRIGQDEAYIWDCATLPDYRRKHLFGVLLGHVADRLRHEGLRRLWIIGASAPRRLLHGVAAAGFEPVLRLTYLRVLDKHGLLATPLPGASSQQIQDARRILKADQEHAVGPLILGNSARPVPPDTHFDR